MSVSGISSSSFMSQNIASVQNQQQQIQRQFQALAQEFQSGNLSPAQTTALQQQGLQTSATTPVPGSTTAAPADPSNIQSGAHHAPVHSHHSRHAHKSSNSADSDQDSTAPSLGQLGQPIQSGTASTAQQAYGSLQQDLQQVALNSDLLNAQSGTLESSGLSLMV